MPESGSRAVGEERRFIRICRNPHEPFYWDTDNPDDPCPGQGCEDGEHETWVRASALLAAQERAQEAEKALKVSKAQERRLAREGTDLILDEERYRDRAEAAERSCIESEAERNRLEVQVDELKEALDKIENVAVEGMTMGFDSPEMRLTAIVDLIRAARAAALSDEADG